MPELVHTVPFLHDLFCRFSPDVVAFILLVVSPVAEERRRIVARADRLMSLCDELEAGFMRSQADSERLMEAVVGRMLVGE